MADNMDEESLRAAFEGAYGIYAITTWSGSTFGADGAVGRERRERQSTICHANDRTTHNEPDGDCLRLRHLLRLRPSEAWGSSLQAF